MNVLQIVPELNAGGVERTTIEIAEALRGAGHTAHVASAGGRLEGELDALGGRLHKFDVGSKNLLKYRQNKKALIEIIRDYDIDIVHARSRAPAWPGFAAAKATGKPFLTTYHGIYNANSNLKRRYNGIMTQGELIIANSLYTKFHIVAEHGIDPDKIRVIPRAVDMERFDLADLHPRQIEAQFKAWDVPLDSHLVLLPGRLTRWKGQLVAIEALSHLPDDYALICMGDAQGRDEYIAEMHAACAKYKLEHRVILPGHSTEVPAAIACADIIISASTDPEAFGRVAAEAQAMQRPIVATAHGGALETVIDGKTGFLVPPGDAGALAKSIEKAANWDDYDGPAARAHILDNFSKQRLQRDTLAVYKALMT